MKPLLNLGDRLLEPHKSVALAAGAHIPVTYFVEVAPVAMMCADIESAPRVGQGDTRRAGD
jgi:hypothetical protein